MVYPMPRSHTGPRRSRNRRHSLLFNVVVLLVCGLLAGVMAATVVFPGLAASGLLMKSSAEGFDRLATDLPTLRLPQVTYVYAADRKTLISAFYDENRHYVPLSAVAPVMGQAVVAAEDMRFYQHHGVDLRGVVRAFLANRESGATEQGASTLTMQYVRLILQYSATTPQQAIDAASDTPQRKLREMRYALALEKQLTKREILERYLNITSFGNGTYGVYAASHVYFGKSPDRLTLGEAALLVGLVKAPTAFDPLTAVGRRRALDRRDNYVLPNMVKLGYITEAQREEVIAEPLHLTGRPTPNGCVSVLENSWGFFCDYLYRWWLRQPSFGADEYERAARLKTGGYTIITSLNVRAQASATANIETYDRTGSNPTALMLAGVEPGSGRIELMATNRNYSNDQTDNGPNTNPAKRGQKGNYPNTTNPLISGGGDITGYQAGSSFKMFTLVAALEKGLSLDYKITTTSPYVSKYIIDPHSPAACHGAHYCPVNANPTWMNGVRNMWTGLGRSVNTYWVPMEEIVGAQNVVNVAKRLGIQFRAASDANLADHAEGWGAFTLGVSATTSLDMATAYAALAADGMYCEPTPVIEIRDSTGAALDAAQPQCRRAVDVNVARAAIDALRCPVGDQSAFHGCDGATAAPVRRIVGKPIAGKTGTTDLNSTATLIAMTRQLAVAGIVADPDWALTTRLKNDLGGRDPHSQVVNPAVAYTLRDAMIDMPSLDFDSPPPTMAFGRSGRWR
jgi:membrane peptidoglycan carboxypeptidase